MYICGIIYLFRSTRLIFLLAEIKSFDLILSTFLGFTMPFFTMFLSFYTIYYYFAQFGMLFFAAKITTVSA